MRSWIRTTFTGLFLLLCSAVFAVSLPYPPSVMTNVYTFKELGWTSALTLNGYAPSHTLYLPLAKRSRPQRAIVHLKIEFSPLLNEDTRLEIKFNQTLLRTLSPPPPTEPLTLDIELPLTNLSSTWQELNFSVTLSSAKKLCNPDVWVYVLPESTVTVDLPELPFSGSLDEVAQLFLDTTVLEPISPLFLLPSSSSFNTLFSAFYIAMRLGHFTESDKINLRAWFLDQSQDILSKHNLILVGTEQELKAFPPYVQQITPKIEQDIKNKKGLVLLKESPFNPLYGLLTFTGIDKDSLAKAINAFLLPEFNQIASGQVVSVNSVDVSSSVNAKVSWYQTPLSALNYTDQTVTGLGYHKLTYNLLLPTDRIPKGATIKTLITSSVFGKNNNSQIILIVNGQKQSVLIFDKNHSAWTAQINPSALKPGVNVLEYEIDLHLEHEHCTLQDHTQAWATIYSDTEVSVTFLNDYPFALLNQFPVPFSSEINFIVPDRLGQGEINKLIRLFFKLGQLIPENLLEIKCYSAAEVNEQFIRSHNLILFGTPDSNPWVKFALDYMPVRLKNNERVLQLAKKQIELSGNSSTGLLELMQSPWSTQRAVLLISGTEEEGLNNALEQFIHEESRSKLNGNIALINSNNLVELLNTDEGHYMSLKDQIGQYVMIKANNIIFYVRYHPQVFIYLLVFLVPLAIYQRRRPKK